MDTFRQKYWEAYSAFAQQHQSAGFKYGNLTYNIHTVQVADLAGKILAFFASLISASLPITRLIIYLGKQNKGDK
jgi:hypothetical protein